MRLALKLDDTKYLLERSNWRLEYVTSLIVRPDLDGCRYQGLLKKPYILPSVTAKSNFLPQLNSGGDGACRSRCWNFLMRHAAYDKDAERRRF